ncbi:MAG: NAD(P)H-binding protein [Rubricella sp.]
MSLIVVLGAYGATGQAVVKQARAAGHAVRLGVRRYRDGAEAGEVVTDLLGGTGLGPACDGADAVINCAGVGNDPVTLSDPPPLYSEGASNIVEAAGAAGVPRAVFISALWSRENLAGPLSFRLSAVMALTRVYADMRRMEDVLSAQSAVEAIAVRAGRLGSSPGTPHEAFPARPPAGWWQTDRDALAGFLLRCALEGSPAGSHPAFVHG